MTRTANTHDKGALFGFDGQSMWIEQTLDAAAVDAGPSAIFHEHQAGELPITLSFGIKCF